MKDPDSRNRKSILWIHGNFVTAKQSGNSRPVHILASFCRHGFKTYIIAPRTGYLGDISSTSTSHKNDEQQNELLTVEHITLSKDYSNLYHRPKAYLQFIYKSFLRSIRIRDINLIYCSTPPLPQVVICIIISILRKAPLILEVRDLWPAYLKDCNFVTSKLALFILGWIEAFAYRCADHCIGVSPSYQEYFIRMGIPEKKVTIVPTGSDPVYSATSKSVGHKWRKQHGYENDFLIIYTGSFNETYHFETILITAGRLQETHPNITWLFAGNGRQLHLIQTYASQYSSIKYLGNFSKDDLLPVYLAADVGILTHSQFPTLKTALSGKVFDYIGAGLFVISFADGITGELVHIAQAGIVLDKPDSIIFEKAVLDTMNLDPQERATVGTHAQQWILNNINAITMGDRVSNIAENTFQKKSRMALFLKGLQAFFVGFVDAVTNRSHKIIQEILERDLEETSKKSWQEWLKTNEKNFSDFSNASHIVPEILTSIDRESQQSKF